MYIYIISLLFSLIFGIIVNNNNSLKNTKIYILTMFLMLCLISSFRSYNIGTDTLAYVVNYIDINNTFKALSIFNLPMEPLFNLLNRVTYILNSQPQTILFTTSFIINILVVCRIYKSSKYPWISIYLYISLYIFYQSFNGIRQYIAIAIIFYISKYIDEKKPFKFILGVVIASGFHTTALIFLPFYIIGKIRIDRKKVFLIFIISFLILNNFNDIINIFLKMFNRYEVYNDSFFNEPGGARDVIISFVIVLFGRVMANFYKSNKQLDILNIYMFIYFIISLMVLKGSANLIIRIGWYFSIFITLYIPEVLYTIKDRKIRSISIYVVISISFFYHIYLLLNNFHNIVPYELISSKIL